MLLCFLSEAPSHPRDLLGMRVTSPPLLPAPQWPLPGSRQGGLLCPLPLGESSQCELGPAHSQGAGMGVRHAGLTDHNQGPVSPEEEKHCPCVLQPLTVPTPLPSLGGCRAGTQHKIETKGQRLCACALGAHGCFGLLLSVLICQFLTFFFF